MHVHSSLFSFINNWIVSFFRDLKLFLSNITEIPASKANSVDPDKAHVLWHLVGSALFIGCKA